MANASTEIDLDRLQAAIAADIKAQFPALRVVEFYREDRKSLPTPACLLELTELEALSDEDPGTEQQAFLAGFEAELVISFREQNSKAAIRKLAAALATWLRLRRWTDSQRPGKKLPTGPAQVGGAYPDDFKVMGGARDQELQQFEVWRVEWRQIIHLGATVWADEGETPSEVYMGQAPEVGVGNESAYVKVSP